jgi:hypothetical protein
MPGAIIRARIHPTSGISRGGGVSGQTIHWACLCPQLTPNTPLLPFVSPRQIHQDSIKDLLVPGAATRPPISINTVPGRVCFSAGGLAGGPAGGASSPGTAHGAAAASSPPAGSRLLSYRDPDPTKDIMLLGLEEVKVTDRRQLLQCLMDGLRARTTAATNVNAHSSRSHAIFTVRVRQTVRRVVQSGRRGGAGAGGPGAGQPRAAEPAMGEEAARDEEGGGRYDYLEETLEAKLHLVDLAGSERIGKSGVAGARLLETCSINQGLLALGNVIEALSDRRR